VATSPVTPEAVAELLTAAGFTPAEMDDSRYRPVSEGFTKTGLRVLGVVLHVLGVIIEWAAVSLAHVLVVAVALIVLVVLLRRPKPQRVVARESRLGGLAALVLAVGGLGLGWWLLAHPQKTAPAAAPKPVTRTVIRVVHAAAPSSLTGIEHTVIIVVAIILAFGVMCAVLMRGRSG
jgi:hypothetical protein